MCGTSGYLFLSLWSLWNHLNENIRKRNPLKHSCSIWMYLACYKICLAACHLLGGYIGGTATSGHNQRKHHFFCLGSKHLA
jgi:hypothetical protein